MTSDSRWPLDAPTSWVLWQGAHKQGRAALRLAVIELVARRVLTVERRRRRSYLVAADGAPTAGGPVGAMASLIAGLPTHELGSGRAGVPLGEIRRAVPLRWHTPDGFVEAEVVPVLVERQLVDIVQEWGWLLPRIGLKRLELGYQAWDDLNDRLRALRSRLPDLARANPQRALAMIARTGSAVLLSEECWRIAAQLYRERRGLAGDPGQHDPGALDLDGLGGLDLGALGGLNFDWLDGLDGSADGGD